MLRTYKRQLGSRAYQNYSPSRLQKAIEDVKGNKLSIRKAAEKWGVPKSIISNAVANKSNRKVGGQTVLSDDEERQLIQGITTSSE